MASLHKDGFGLVRVPVALKSPLNPFLFLLYTLLSPFLSYTLLPLSSPPPFTKDRHTV